tara:strand:+ start:362 stop:1399 length:1038 start_codon:yes stop_codon:yes gene_type:complete
MGLKFKDLIVKNEISVNQLKGKIVVIDSMNLLYQFLTTIRGPDGSAFLNKGGNVTSHLIGLFNRTTFLMEKGLKLVFVFDGKAPALKQKTWEKRTALKKEASLKLKEAEEAGDLESMRKFSSRTVKLDKKMIEDAQEVITLLGLPIVQAPSEGEAQTAYMTKIGDAYASISQDYDNLIFGCPRLVRNLSIEGKRKRAGKFAYKIVKTEQILLRDVLSKLELEIDQLIVLAILIGTDYNPGGVKGIGPKTGLKLLREFPNNFSAIFKKVEWGIHYPELEWEEIFNTIKQIPTTRDYKLEWREIQEDKLVNLLVNRHDFNLERVKSKLNKLKGQQGDLTQKGLSSFF